MRRRPVASHLPGHTDKLADSARSSSPGAASRIASVPTCRAAEAKGLSAQQPPHRVGMRTPDDSERSARARAPASAAGSLGAASSLSHRARSRSPRTQLCPPMGMLLSKASLASPAAQELTRLPLRRSGLPGTGLQASIRTAQRPTRSARRPRAGLLHSPPSFVLMLVALLTVFASGVRAGCPDFCNGHGNCDARDGGLVCSCFDGWSGPSCASSEVRTSSACASRALTEKDARQPRGATGIALPRATALAARSSCRAPRRKV